MAKRSESIGTVDTYTAGQLAARLQVTPRTLLNWRRQGRIPKPRIDSAKKPLWSRAQIEAWLAKADTETAA